jgi:heme-degrading monooxygenase HmoA
MFARVRITSEAPDNVDDGIRHFREVVVSGFKDVDGFKGGYMLVNRDSGKLIGITLWDTEASMHATAAAPKRLRAATTQVVSAPEAYEVVVQP